MAPIYTPTSSSPFRRVLLAGSPASLRQLRHSLSAATHPPEIIGAVTDADDQATIDPSIAVLGRFAQAAELAAAHRADAVLIGLPARQSAQAQGLIAELDHRQIAWRLTPSIDDQLAGRLRGVLAPLIHATIDPQVLIDRQPRALDEGAIRRLVGGKVVLITGAGGSIGSQLARTVARFEPASLVLVERAENPLFEIDQQIHHIFPQLNRSAVLHDVADSAKTLAVVMAHKPDVIFHAAAHKHVPMMEDHPSAAVENNFYGTRAIADAAAKTGVDRFVMISTDKAVNPSSVMGATKRLAELYIQYLNARSDTTFSMVRFGNVLGSNCSVLTIWSRQLAHGGPITVTDPNMTRYFMTIPEAAGLVIQSAAYSNWRNTGGGEVFLLDMGEPINILELSRRFIHWHGLEPELDVAIAITGVRPGEKLFEQLAYDGEDMIETPHESIRIWRTAPPDAARMQQIVQTFDRLRAKRDGADHFWRHASHDAILNALRVAVPEMVGAVERAAG